jgi:hypothetical protein
VLQSQCHVGISRDRFIALIYLDGFHACPGCGRTHHKYNGDEVPIYLVMEFDHIVSTGASGHGRYVSLGTNGLHAAGGTLSTAHILKIGPQKAKEIYQALCKCCHGVKTREERGYTKMSHREVLLQSNSDEPPSDQQGSLF